MQARHLDRKTYFEDSAITSSLFYLPYIRKFHLITSCSKILEIGCGEGGNLKPFANIGCQVFGVDMAQIRIEQARQFFSEEKLKGHFESGDFLEYPTPSEDDKFDIAILHDVIEHVPDKIAFLSHIRKFLKEDGILFVAFLHGRCLLVDISKYVAIRHGLKSRTSISFRIRCIALS